MDKQSSTQQERDTWAAWFERESAWTTKQGTIHNEEQGGYIEQTSHYLIAAATTTITQIDIPENTMETRTMDDILDEPNTRYSDYFSWVEPANSDNQEQSQDPTKAAIRAKMKVTLEDGATKDIYIFDADRPAPNIIDGRYTVGPDEFAIETKDGALPSTVRPIRRHELLKALGYEQK
jgi:hypothetical protein